MKLYSRKNFILGLLCGLIIIFEWKHYDGAKSILWIAFFAYMGVRSIIASFSKEACEQEEAASERDARVRARILGPFGRFAELIALGLCLLGGVLYGVLWQYKWSGVLLFVCLVAAAGFALWFNVKYHRLMDEEKQNDEETKS